jgi:hypothetical protein
MYKVQTPLVTKAAYLIYRHGGVWWVVIDALEVAVGFIIDLLTKVLVSLWPHLREVRYKRRKELIKSTLLLGSPEQVTN